MGEPRVPVIVTARDEQRAIGACLDSLARAIDQVWHRLGVRCELAVVLDDCTDATAEVVASRGVSAIASTGGKVEAQRTAVRARRGDVHVFCDADVIVTPETLVALLETMSDPAVHVAFPDKRPLPPRRRSVLARALHLYNARRGFSSQRTWFSGKLFAIRGWTVPDGAQIARRARTLPASAFYAYGDPLRVDDIYLSRAVRHTHGAGALRETAGIVWFRAPETWRGMYRYYRRMRRELERIDRLFPESRAPRHDHRVVDQLLGAPLGERALHGVFASALAACRVAYRAERFACDRLGMPARDPWPAIAETK